MKSRKLDLDTLCNDGERLIPFITHNDEEVIRHFSSHLFFKKILENDQRYLKNSKQFSILDLGFGTGYASCIYANINNVKSVTAIDVSEDLLEWAKENYYNKKIKYQIKDARKFLDGDVKYSYIITRHVLEHIEDGLSFIKEKNFKNRLMINVPYNEPKGNPHHILTGITEKNFPKYKNIEFFYEDLNGNTYMDKPKGVYINSIICIASRDGLPRVSSYFKFPLKATTVMEAYETISEDNFNLANNILKKQIERGLSYPLNQETLEGLRKYVYDLEKNNKVLNESILNMQKELEAIYRSKKWKYVSRIANIRSKFNVKHYEK